MSTQALAERHEPAGVTVEAPAEASSAGGDMLMRIIERAATSPDFDVAKLEKLLDVRERWEANEARKAFVAALSAFKADPPTVVKNKSVAFGQGDRRTAYDHATLDQVASVIGAALAAHGLAHRWKTEQLDGGMIRVTCVLQHVLGHAESVSLQATPDTSGSKNHIQAVGSAVTYLERYTLMAAVGLAAKDQDTDGGDPTAGGAMISGDEVEEIEALMRETAADQKRFLAVFKIAHIGELPLARFAEAKALLQQKGRQARRKGPAS